MFIELLPARNSLVLQDVPGNMVFRGVSAQVLPWALVGACAVPVQGSAEPTAPKPSLSPPISLTYLGVAGWELDSGDHALLFDPYVTRLRPVPGDPLISDAALVTAHAPARADGILVSHSHYDHLLDVPAFARLTGAAIVGTESTLNVARASGIVERRLLLAHGGERFSLGPFVVHPLRALHALTGQASDPIPPDVTLPMTSDRYGEGGTLQYFVEVDGRRVYFVGTANFIESEVAGHASDIAIVAVGLREGVPDYTCRLLRALGRPSTVFTNHFDAHSQPLGPKQMDIGEEGRADLATFADEVHACSPTTKVVVPEHFERMTL